jgi:hypothetical protein
MNGSTALPSVANGVTTYMLGDEVVLLSTQQQRLYRFNTTAAFIWQCLEERHSEEETTQFFSEMFGISQATARGDITSILQSWRNLGLLEDQDTVDEPGDPAGDDADTCQVALDPDSYRLPESAGSFRLIDTRFDVGFNEARVGHWIAPVIQHLKTSEISPAAIRFDVVTTPDGFAILRDSKAIADGLHLDQVAPYIHAEALLAAYNATECFIAMHSAALHYNGRCILLPGVSGSGKSTLAAALAGSGFDYCTDELTLITKNTHGVRPVPISLGIKEGSWPVLSDYFPGLDALPCHLRRDLKRVRYMPPPNPFLDGHYTEGLPVQLVVFPVYDRHASTTVVPVVPADALCRIADAGYDVSGRLNPEFTSELVSWVGGLTCYELRYSSLRDAVQQVKELVG